MSKKRTHSQIPCKKRFPQKHIHRVVNVVVWYKKKKNVSIYKKKHSKLLRDPVLRLSHSNSSLRHECQHLFSKEITPAYASQKFQPDTCLHTLVDNCNQLSISTEKNQTSLANKSNSVKWWKCEIPSERRSRDVPSERSASCSQQALNPPCDITIDELASYFETLVHIPKKMSSMAEMMYI
uniref:Oxidative stress-responsive serine-rich protein 1 n=1 Tax=Pararge aegeria TaxID=116150 RepID=S4P6P0_9NEOP